MSTATFGRVHTWALDEVIKSSDLNAEFNNILNNLNPPGMGSYSDTVSVMQIQTNPGGLGSESLATSLAGELERLRYVIQRLIGSSVQYWYQGPPTDLTTLITAIGSQVLTTRIISGPTTGNSSQMLALIPSNNTGSSAAVVVAGATTPLIYAIGSTNYTISSNVTFSGLSLAPSTNNTAGMIFTAGVLDGSQWTKALGMYNTTISVTAAGSNINALVGNFGAFQNITGGEVFLGYVNSSVAITNAWRGCFWNASSVNISASGLNDSAGLQLLKLAWVFANNAQSIAVTYDNPIISATQPSSPNTGDYWYDLTSTASGTAWKTFTGSSWVVANAILLGMCAQSTNACVAARTFDSYLQPNSLNTVTPVFSSTQAVVDAGPFSKIAVFATQTSFQDTKVQWNNTLNLDSGVSMTANTLYFMYLKENGTPIISPTYPLQRRDLLGYYHPRETWRAVGSVYSNGSTAFISPARTLRGAADAQTNVVQPNAYAYSAIAQGTSNYPENAYPDNYQISVGPFSTFGSGGGVFNDIATFSLTPGFWRLSAQAYAQITGGTAAATVWNLYISTTQGNTSPADVVIGYNQNQGFFSASNSGASNCVIPRVFAQVSTPGQTFYLKNEAAVYNTATCTLLVQGWSFVAERIDKLVGEAP